MKTFLRVVLYGVAAVIVAFAALIIFADHKHKTQLPPLPIEVKYRKAMLDSSLVVHFENKSGRNLEVLATFENPTMNQKKSFRISLDPNIPKQVGHLEGWAFHSGDKILLHHAEYSDKMSSLP